MSDPRLVPPPVVTAHDRERQDLIDRFPALRSRNLVPCGCPRCEAERRGIIPDPIRLALGCPVCGENWSYAARRSSVTRPACPRCGNVTSAVTVTREGEVGISPIPVPPPFVGAPGFRRDWDAADRVARQVDLESTYEWRFPDSPRVDPKRFQEPRYSPATSSKRTLMDFLKSLTAAGLSAPQVGVVMQDIVRNPSKYDALSLEDIKALLMPRSLDEIQDRVRAEMKPPEPARHEPPPSLRPERQFE